MSYSIINFYVAIMKLIIKKVEPLEYKQSTIEFELKLK